MTGRIVGAVVALFGVGLLALVLNGGGPGPSAVYSRGEGSLLILGTCLCLGGSFYAVKGAAKSATDAPVSSQARPAARHRLGPGRGGSAEAVTMAGAVLVSLVLGGVIGLWITTWRPSSASAVAPPAEPVKVEASAAPASAPPPEETPPPEEPHEMTAAGPTGDAVIKKRDERPEPAAAPEREDNLSTRRVKERDNDDAPKSSFRARGRFVPCTLAASPGALSIRGGGAAAVTLRLDETAGPARVGASTPHWADIAVFAEQPAGAGRARYTVRSVSRRAGVYSVTFRTACGSRTVPVTVKGP